MKTLAQLASRGAVGVSLACGGIITSPAQTVVETPSAEVTQASGQRTKLKLIAETPMLIAEHEARDPDKYLLRASDRLQRGRPEAAAIRAPSVLPELADSVPEGPTNKVIKSPDEPKSGE